MQAKEFKQQRVMLHLKQCKVPFTACGGGVISTGAAVMTFQEHDLQLMRKGKVTRRINYDNLNIDRLIGMLQ